MSPDENEREQKLFDVMGSAKYLQKIGGSSATPSFIRTLIATGQVPHIRIGRKFFISREALDSWLARHERRAR